MGCCGKKRFDETEPSGNLVELTWKVLWVFIGLWLIFMFLLLIFPDVWLVISSSIEITGLQVHLHPDPIS